MKYRRKIPRPPMSQTQQETLRMQTNLVFKIRSLKNPKFIYTLKGYLSFMHISGSMKTQVPAKTRE